MLHYLGVDSQFTVTIVRSPAGTPVSGSDNTFDYPILSSVILTCDVTSNDTSSFTVSSYRWNTDRCYNHTQYTGSNPQCFPFNQITQNVTGNDMNAEDAGTITCTAMINGTNYTSEPFTLRISGDQLVYCVKAFVAYCKQCMLLLLATCYCYYQLLPPYTVATSRYGLLYVSLSMVVLNSRDRHEKMATEIYVPQNTPYKSYT